jgi:hypothetical protein
VNFQRLKFRKVVLYSTFTIQRKSMYEMSVMSDVCR